MNVESLLAHYGAAAVFVGAMAEGESFVLAGGVLAHRGIVSPVAVVIAAFCGSVLADQLCFFLGRQARDTRLVRRVRGTFAFDRALRFIERYPNAYIIAFRYLYGLRVVSPLALGVSRVSAVRFVALNLLSAAIWAVLFTTLGYVFGKAVDRFIARFHLPHPGLIVLGALALLLVIITLVHRLAARGRTAEAEGVSS
jgi:membrane protein DedA with SNARE-associated domain